LHCFFPLATGSRKREVYIIGSALLAAILYNRESMVVKRIKGEERQNTRELRETQIFHPDISSQGRQTEKKKKSRGIPEREDN
jgi:hypothetical protein